jgi:hypothetical protein
VGTECDGRGADPHPPRPAPASAAGNRPAGKLPPEADKSSSCPAGEPTDWAHRGANGIWSTAVICFAGREAFLQVMRSATRSERRSPPASRSAPRGRHGCLLWIRSAGLHPRWQSGRGHPLRSRRQRSLRGGSVIPSGVTILVLSNAGQHEGTTWSSYLARQIVEAIGPASTR